MEAREEFEKDWRSTHSNDPLPHLRFLATTDSDELLTALISDEQDLVQCRDRLQRELDTTTFNLRWVSKKKEEIIAANAANEDSYANVDQNTPRPASYMNNASFGGKPKPRPRGPKKMNTSMTLPRMQPPLPSPGKGKESGSSVKRASSMHHPKPVQVDLNSAVTDDQCRTLSFLIENSYKHFGRQILKFTDTEIETCRRMSTEGDKQAMRMLIKWKQRMGHNATLRVLVGFLKDFGYGPEIWGFLEDPEKYDPRNSPIHRAERRPDFEPYEATIVSGYFTSTPDELSVKKGDTFTIQDRGWDSWLFGEVNGRRGWVPGYCVSGAPTEPAKQTNGSSWFLFVAEARSNSSCFEEGFMDFRRGELLDVLEESVFLTTPCYRVRNGDGRIGLAMQRDCKRVSRKTSILCDREWYHGGLSRGKTEELLRRCPHGTYLVRDASKAPGNFVLCVKSNGEIASLMMDTENDMYKVSSGQFGSIQEAIDYYRRNVIRDRLILTKPALKNTGSY